MLSKKRKMWLLAVLLIPAIALIIGAAAPRVWAQPECWWNIEFNASDLDAGVRGFFDYEPWKELEIENPRGRTIVEVEAERRMARQGLAEWFFESGEPTLFEVPFWRFLRRFPAGFYEFEAETINSHEVSCEELLTHVIPCAPEISHVLSTTDTTIDTITISWDEVDEVIDTAATDANVAVADPEDFEAEDILVCDDPENLGLELEIDGYEVIVEGPEVEFNAKLPAGQRSVTFTSEEPLADGEYQYEVLVIEESGNQTIWEEGFCLLGGIEVDCE